MLEGKSVFLHEIKLEGESAFIKQFNDVSEAYAKAFKDETLTEEEAREAKDIYWQKKLCLELGIR